MAHMQSLPNTNNRRRKKHRQPRKLMDACPSTHLRLMTEFSPLLALTLRAVTFICSTTYVDWLPGGAGGAKEGRF